MNYMLIAAIAVLIISNVATLLRIRFLKKEAAELEGATSYIATPKEQAIFKEAFDAGWRAGLNSPSDVRDAYKKFYGPREN